VFLQKQLKDVLFHDFGKEKTRLTPRGKPSG